jgi:hypothetical protein
MDDELNLCCPGSVDGSVHIDQGPADYVWTQLGEEKKKRGLIQNTESWRHLFSHALFKLYNTSNYIIGSTQLHPTPRSLKLFRRWNISVVMKHLCCSETPVYFDETSVCFYETSVCFYETSVCFAGRKCFTDAPGLIVFRDAGNLLLFPLF